MGARRRAVGRGARLTSIGIAHPATGIGEGEEGRIRSCTMDSALLFPEGVLMRSGWFDGRLLLPRFRYGTSVLAWQCSVCRKLFSVSLREAEQLHSAEAPSHLKHAFEQHSCELGLAVLLDEAQRMRH